MNVRFKAVVPKNKLVDFPALERGMKDALRHGMNIIADDYHKTVNTWSRTVRFNLDGPKSSGFFGRGGLRGFVGTNDKVYQYVDEGTRAHVIRPRRGGMLRFRTGYRAKTRPGIISSYAGGASGGVAWARQVFHPGTAARDFTKTIERRRRRPIETLLRAAFLKSLRARKRG